jgi:hypothetical protein
MPMDHNGDLMQALVAKLYATVTGDDDAIKIPRNKYVSWFLPGVPFSPADFKYCATGFTGNTAEEIRNAYHQAFVLSSLFDYIPDTSTGFVEPEMQQTIFAGTGDRISTVYNDVLKYSRVVDRPLSQAEEAKLKKFRDLLTVEVEETDILTDTVKLVSKPGKLTVAYTEKMNDYLTVADELMDMKIDALSATGDDPESRRRVYNWNEKAKFVKRRLEAAEMAWTSQGYKNEYEIINGYIEQVTEKSLVLYKEDLKRKFANALTTSVVDGDSEFYYTTLLPGNFATATSWSDFSFTESDYETHAKSETTGWGASAGVNFGLFSFGGSASGSTTTSSDDQSAANFSASFKFTQVPICRPWFEPGFFKMRSWTLDDNWNLSYPDQPVSNGQARDNTGRLVAYATSALFVDQVRITSSQWSNHSDYIAKSVSAGGSVGYGPFSVGGSYSHGSTSGNTAYHFEGDTLVIDGIQLVGTINNLIPQSPNPAPGLKPEDFVGGA